MAAMNLKEALKRLKAMGGATPEVHIALRADLDQRDGAAAGVNTPPALSERP